MGFRHWKWYEFPLMVKYGESGVLLHLNKSLMLYMGDIHIKCKVYLDKPELFTPINSETYKHKVIVEQQPVIIDWCIGEQPEKKSK